MIAKTSQVQLSVEDLNTLLTGKTNDSKINTIPEVFDQFERGIEPAGIRPMTNIEIDEIISNSLY